FRVVVVAREHTRAARDDFSLDAAVLRRRGVLALGVAALHGPDVDLDAGQRAALGAEPRVRAVVEREHRRGLGQAVAGEHRPAETLEPPRELGIELRAAAADQIEAFAEALVHGLEQPFADPRARRAAHRYAQAQHPVEQLLRARAALLDRAANAVPKRLAEP